MTVTSENKRNQYTITEAQVIFPYTFCILNQEHLLVIHTTAAGVETELELTTNYTVSGVGDVGGGNVTTCGIDSPYPTGDTITIIRDVPLTQLLDYVEHDMFPAASHEKGLDQATMIIQEFAERLDRAVLLLKSSAYSDLDIPDPVAGKLLAWKDDLSGLKNIGIESEGDLTVTDYIKTLLDDEDISAALTTLGVTAFVKTLLEAVNAAAALIILGLTATAAEINTACNGILATATEINKAADGIVYAPVTGDATAGRILRASRLYVQDATEAGKIKCTLFNEWNGKTMAVTDNIAKNSTVGGFTLNSDGTELRLETATLGAVVLGVLSAECHNNNSGTPTQAYGHESNDDIAMDFTDPTAGTGVDLTGLVDTAKSFYVLLTYITED